VGLGAAARLTGAGRDSLAALRGAWGRTVAGTVVAAEDGPGPSPLPTALGGLAFDPERAREPAWSQFPDAELVVPELLLEATPHGAWFTLAVAVGPADDPGEAVAAAARRCLGANGHYTAAAPLPVVPAAAPNGRHHWQAAVLRARAEIEGRRLEKVVLARQALLRLDVPFAPEEALRRLGETYPECTLFAVDRGGTCFVGATPEPLVRLSGRRVETTCLAGSRRRGATAAEDAALEAQLRSDPKECHEHDLVVRELTARLATLCSSLDVAREPTVLKVANVQHLMTPVEGRAVDGLGLLDLVERLHPTPAIGGLPADRALDLIRSVEPFDRGWYTGAVMWLGADGGGEAVVAIRSALVTGANALLYAGCGIVGASDPEREYDESSLKMETMRWALSPR
jgi:isochorismate synthase